MKKLEKEVKQFITQQLARFCTPQEVVELVKINFNITITRQHVFYFDAEKNQNISEHWKAIFDATREKFLNDVVDLPLSKKIVRIKKLSKFVEKFEENENYVAAAAVLKQIAKETGGMFTNRREVSGRGINSIVVHAKNLEEWNNTAAERRSAAAKTGEMFND